MINNQYIIYKLINPDSYIGFDYIAYSKNKKERITFFDFGFSYESKIIPSADDEDWEKDYAATMLSIQFDFLQIAKQFTFVNLNDFTLCYDNRYNEIEWYFSTIEERCNCVKTSSKLYQIKPLFQILLSTINMLPKQNSIICSPINSNAINYN